MALIEFKNLPDTTAPLNAENINHNFSEITNNITLLKENMGKTWTYSIPNINGIPANSWQPLGHGLKTDNLPSGVYLLIASAILSTQKVTYGECTLNPYIDGSSLPVSTWQTIPIGYNGLLVGGQCLAVVNFKENAEHTINMYAFSNGIIDTVSSLEFTFIKLQ